jgi:hypothetical protein
MLNKEDPIIYTNLKVKSGILRLRNQKQNTTPNNNSRHNPKHRLRLPPTLHQSRFATILLHGGDIQPKPTRKTGETHAPKHNAQG